MSKTARPACARGVQAQQRLLEELERAGAPLPESTLLARALAHGLARAALRRALRSLERSGRVLRNRAGHLLVAARLDVVTGRVLGHPDGHGWLESEESGARVYLPFAVMRRLMHGDRAAVRIEATDARGRPVGALVEVLERANQPIPGRLEAHKGLLLLRPAEPRIGREVLVPPRAAAGARPGEAVCVQLDFPPGEEAPALGRVVERLGRAGDPEVEIEVAVRRFGLPHVFPASALAAARRLAPVGEAELRGRRDLRALEFVTIDGETARDRDDAVCAHLEGDELRLWVAIADVSHYVRRRGALDAAARERATSVYFPRRVIPMLPERLSNDLCSLAPQADRLAVVCEMRLSRAGAIRDFAFYPALIRSRAALVYERVQAKLESGRAAPPLAALHACYRALAEARSARGAMDFASAECRFEFDARGAVARIVPVPRTEAHRLIEECMLAANVCAGELLLRHGQPALWRVHAVPDPARVAALRAFLAELGLELGGGEAPRPQDYARLLARVRERADRDLLETIVLRSLKQAHYSARNVGHFGLAFDAYVHFTSPIRRYPDLVVHRALRACRAGRRAEDEDWEALARHCSQAERRAEEASRDVEAWLKCEFMRRHVGEVFEGRVTGVAPFGAFVTLERYFVEGLVHVSSLGRDYFRHDPVRHQLVGERTGRRVRLADRLRVRLLAADAQARRLELAPA